MNTILLLLTIILSFNSYADLDENGDIISNSPIKASDINARFQSISESLAEKGLSPIQPFTIFYGESDVDGVTILSADEISKQPILDNFSYIPSELGLSLPTLSDNIISTELNTGFNNALSAIVSYVRTQECYPPNASSGQQTWDSTADTWGACLPLACNSGFTLQNNNCISDTADDVILAFESSPGGNTTFSSSSLYGTSSRTPVVINNKAYFPLSSYGKTPANDVELIETDGTILGSKRYDIFPGIRTETTYNEETTYELCVAPQSSFFSTKANCDQYEPNGYSVWVTADNNSTEDLWDGLANDGYCQIFYQSPSDANGRYPTCSSSYAVGINPETLQTPVYTDYINNGLVAVRGEFNGKLILQAQTATSVGTKSIQIFDPNEPFFLDPISGGTTICSVAETNPCVAEDTSSANLFIRGIYNNELYFTMQDSVGYQLWKMDSSYSVTKLTNTSPYSASYGVQAFHLDESSGLGLLIYRDSSSSSAGRELWHINLNNPITSNIESCSLGTTNPCDMKIEADSYNSNNFIDNNLFFTGNYCNTDMLIKMKEPNNVYWLFKRLAIKEATYRQDNNYSYELATTGTNCSSNLTSQSCTDNNCIWAVNGTYSPTYAKCINTIGEDNSRLADSDSDILNPEDDSVIMTNLQHFHCGQGIPLTPESNGTYLNCPNSPGYYTQLTYDRHLCKASVSGTITQVIPTFNGTSGDFTLTELKQSSGGSHAILGTQLQEEFQNGLTANLVANLYHYLGEPRVTMNYYLYFDPSQPFDNNWDMCDAGSGLKTNPCLLRYDGDGDGTVDVTGAGIHNDGITFNDDFFFRANQKFWRVSDSGETFNLISDTISLNNYGSVVFNNNFYFSGTSTAGLDLYIHKLDSSGNLTTITGQIGDVYYALYGKPWIMNNEIYFLLWPTQDNYPYPYGYTNIELFKLNKY